VGAVAFASGVTHTISAAVIAVEMSGNLEMILPCLIVAVISAGITKALGLSVYDQV
jgi:H+/Cl- antiporter ClcA